MSLFALPILGVGLAIPIPSADFVREHIPDDSQLIMDLFVDPEGRITRCAVILPEPEADRGAEFCDEVIGEVFGTPAQGLEGEAVHGGFVGSIVRRIYWQESDPTLRGRLGSGSRLVGREPPVATVEVEADLQILLAEMPGGMERHYISLTVYIDASGRVLRCRESPSADRAFSEVACAQATAHEFTIERNDAGEPVPYVTVINVEFLLEESSAPDTTDESPSA